MTTTGPDASVTCAGCGLVIGKFTAPDGKVFTTKTAHDEYVGA
jgi:hypothetical protein